MRERPDVVRIPRGSLLVDDLVGSRVMLPPGGRITLGRAAEFPIGADDPAMHRLFLSIWDNAGTWMISNTGSFISALIIARGDNRFPPQRLATKAVLPIPPGKTSVTFDTKHMSYEIALHNAIEVRTERVIPPDAPFTAEGFEPSAEQALLLRALAAPLWADPASPAHVVVPSVEKLAAQLGWTQKQTNQKIQRIVDALERAGVPEFQRGSVKVPARIRLAQYAAEQYEGTEW